MTNENSLQTFISLYEEIRNLLEYFIKNLNSFNKVNNLKDKIELSIRIKRTETFIIYKTSHFSNFYVTNRNQIDKEYAKKLIFNLQEEITKTNNFKKKIFMQKHKSKFLQKLKEKSTKNIIQKIEQIDEIESIVTDDSNETETDDSLIFI